MTWTPERIDILRAAHKDGLSAGQTAKLLPGHSRNAVIGKAMRLGLGPWGGGTASAPRHRPVVAKPPPKLRGPRPQRTFTKIAMTPAIAPVIPATRAPDPEPITRREDDLPGPNACSLMDLTESRCKWPLGPLLASPALFCGEALDPERDKVLPPYCPCHMKRALSPANDKRRVSVKDLIRGLRRFAA